jgi:pimeloyl-ACP methyl ester carboxylesterase
MTTLQPWAFPQWVAAQARAFAADYRVVDRYDGKVPHTYVDDFGVEQQATLDTGLSVTLFERLADGHRVVAIRGTEVSDLRDFHNDVLLALGVSKALPQMAALKAKVQEWLETGRLSRGFTVTGHSLGGFLATSLTAAFSSQIANVYAYNAPGIGGVLAGGAATGLPYDQVRQVLQLLVVSMSGVDPSKVTNVRALQGITPIAGLGALVGTGVDVLAEEQALSSVAPKGSALDHSQAMLTEEFATLRPDGTVRRWRSKHRCSDGLSLACAGRKILKALGIVVCKPSAWNLAPAQQATVAV